MQLLLSSGLTIKEVNKNFQEVFPYLKLVFYNFDSMQGQTSLWDDSVDVNTTLGKIAGDFTASVIELEGSETVAEVEEKIQRQFGLFVKIYQNVNGVWQETSQSSHLELDKQNAIGVRSFRYSFNMYTLYL